MKNFKAWQPQEEFDKKKKIIIFYKIKNFTGF